MLYRTVFHIAHAFAFVIVAMCPNPSTADDTKTIYLIRHAESEENRRLGSLKSVFKSLGGFSLPSASDIKASTELLNVPAQVDSSVSDVGAQQIAEMGARLKEVNFVVTENIQLVYQAGMRCCHR